MRLDNKFNFFNFGKSRIDLFAIVFGFLVLLLPFYFFRQIHFPLTLDEASNQAVMTYWRDFFCILPGYQLIYGWINFLFPGSYEVFRIWNLCLAIFLFIAGYMILTRILNNTRSFVTLITYSVVFFLIPPTLMSYVFVEENYLLAVGIIGYLYYFFAYKDSKRIRDLVLANTIYILLLSIKFTTELIFPAFMVLIMLYERYYLKKDSFRMKDFAYLYMIPFGLFFLCYSIYIAFVANYSFLDPFKYQFERYASIGILNIIGQILLLVIYFSPFFFILMAKITWSALKKDQLNLNLKWLVLLFWIIMLFFLKGFIFSGSYPKYLIVCFYLSTILLANYFLVNKFIWSKRDVLILFAAYIYFYLFLRDPMLFAYPLTNYIWTEPLNRSIFVHDIMVKISIFSLPLVLIPVFKKSIIKYLLIMLLACSLSTITYQASHDYSLRLAYGEKGYRDLIEWGRKNIPKTATNYAVKDVIYTLFQVLPDYKYSLMEYDKDVNNHLIVIAKKLPEYVVYRDYWLPTKDKAYFYAKLEAMQYELIYHKGNFIVFYRKLNLSKSVKG